MTFRGRPARGVRTAATLNGQGPCHARVTHARGTGEVGHRGPEGATAGERVFCDNSVEVPLLYGKPKVKKVEKKNLGPASDVAHLR